MVYERNDSGQWLGKLVDLAARIFSFLIERSPSRFWGWIVAIFILAILALFFLFLVFTAGRGFLEALANVITAYKSSGLPMTLNRDKRAKVRRRGQFCRVLSADLASLAKSENWNDQNFTDLEAEIETEGGYYASALSQLLGRLRYGLRRVPSLMQAIESSSERAILLVGEPGSGKSVALRHLATQMAERAVRSANPRAAIPLYLNLRELSSASPGQLNADFIRRFVLDNIRRGDADTAAYVRDNWNDNRDQGIWFFLFDSLTKYPKYYMRRLAALRSVSTRRRSDSF